MTTTELWRPIAGFPGYQVSSLGRVVSHRRRVPHEMVGSYNQRGYRMVGLSRPGLKLTTRTVHRLVAEAFLGPAPSGMQIRHLDGDKNNNTVSNLIYGTASENILDQVVHGVHNNARKTHCPRNHPYDADNTYVIPSNGGRMCRTCIRDRQASSALRAAGISTQERAA